MLHSRHFSIYARNNTLNSLSWMLYAWADVSEACHYFWTQWLTLMNVRNWGGSLEGHWSFLWRHSVLFWSQGRSITSSNWMVGMKISSICGHALYLTIFRVRSFPDVSIDLGIIWHDITYFECQGTGSRDHDTCSSPLVRDRNEAYTITGGWTNNHFAGLANTRISGIRSNSRPNSP
mgnify:FL=1